MGSSGQKKLANMRVKQNARIVFKTMTVRVFEAINPCGTNYYHRTIWTRVFLVFILLERQV